MTIYVEDVNDNAPEFAGGPYEISVSEGSPLGLTVATLTATDRDLPHNTNLTYSLARHGNLAGAFRVEPLSGALVVAGQLSITVQGKYNLTVSAHDGKYTVEVSVHKQ